MAKAYSDDLRRKILEAYGRKAGSLRELIEQCWGKVKQKLRSLKPRTVEALQQAISEAIATITPDNASAWFVHCGYDLQ